MSDLSERFAREAPGGHPNQPPKDAATLILLDRSGAVPKVLMGRRSDKHVFMPGRYVFPGGSVDADDRLMSVASPLNPRAELKLMRKVQRATPAKARALALAAVRETFEETGLLLGSRRDDAPATPAGPWSAFAEARVHPDLASIHFIARAITPPRRVRRYDTRFFAADAGAIAHKIDGKVGPDSELVELVWLPVTDTKHLQLMAITEIVLETLQEQIAGGFGHDLPVPFYRVLHGKRTRELL